MKIKFEAEIDTNEDRDIGYEILQLLQALKDRIEQINEEEYDE
jgi:hypothetical protein